MNLAIKGHPKRGKEVIETLEMLGGRNPHNYCADCDSLCFTIDKGTNIIYCDWVKECYEDEDTLVFTLEEFLEKFPYKVGDKVWLHHENLTIRTTETIISMRWCSKYDCVLYDVCTCCNLKEYAFTPYKEETMEEKETMKGDEGTLVAIDLTREIKKANEIEVILGDYEFVLKDGKIYFVKKIQYPKTYEECCEVIGINRHDIEIDLPQTYQQKMFNLFKLHICRDAYWKIAGEEMGLDGSWEPDYITEDNQLVYIITTQRGYLSKNTSRHWNYILAFPTKEMRDAFYENFKELIENCKELL